MLTRCPRDFQCSAKAGRLMGTYMSAFIEVDHSESSRPFSDPTQIFSLTEGSFSFGKDYDVFDALAWGRDSQMAVEDRDPRRRPLIAPRGMPSPQSSDVAWDYFYLINESNELPNKYFWPAHRCVSQAIADKWIRERGVSESEVVQWFNCGGQDRIIWRAIAEPGLYNASWLLLSEFDASLAHHNLRLGELPTEYSILHQALSLLVQGHGPERVRLVLWFS
jgi:hypothetical protein